jgi:hypothetical protein
MYWCGKTRRYLRGHTRRRFASGAGRGCYAPLHAPALLQARWYRELEKSKELLLVDVSVKRVGQRTTEHNRSSSPPGSSPQPAPVPVPAPPHSSPSPPRFLLSGACFQTPGVQKMWPQSARVTSVATVAAGLGACRPALLS